ncbi:unnamed protein product [Acanthoscelides obtectus]|uniref:Nuclear pore complex NUP2/50/61 domain-containing protein n=2 Tax=Acanthoscelides obtectus TaxID=200917 RepID=A0A9P0PWA7_ACAOB|nr:unnamed protein product [Acanthoscelides obtectus]CAK1620674.1 Nuclear pore complex protein Nup50 [Acanthoscelides obtectus]
MAAKRTATTDLNHENWNREDEPEEQGSFQQASEEQLKNRIIKTARRRNPISSVRNSEDADGKQKNIFTGFTAFAKAPAAAPTGQFSFLSNLNPQKDQPKTNGIQDSSKNKNDSVGLSVSSTISIFGSNSTAANRPEGKSEAYLSKLKGLNESVSKWIKQHVDANPLINLKPVFEDYEKYFKDLELEEVKATASENKSEASNKKEETASSMSTFKFKSMQNVPDSTTGKAQTDTKVEQGKNEKSSTSIPKFSFGTMPVNTTASAVQPPFFSSTATSNTFSFSSSNASSTSTSPSMSFGKSTSSAVTFTPAMAPFSFGAPLKPTEQVKKPEENKDANDDEDEPPKVEFTPVEEKGHIYTTRCKVFVKKEESGFADRGVGNLYLKPIEGSEKIQLIVRADTNLGNFHALLLWVLVLIDVVL